MEHKKNKRLDPSPVLFWLITILITGILFAVMALRTGYLLFHTTGVYYWKVFYQRGLPPVIGCSLICTGIIAVILIRSRENVRKTLHQDRKKWGLTAVLLLIGLVSGLLISRTRWGLEKENAFWGKPTVSLLEWHLILSFAVCLLWFAADHFTAQGIPEKIKGWLPLIIWLIAVITWTAIPNQNGFFSPAGRAPNFETYPFSDGSFYGHYARAAAAGMGYKGNDIPPRPLYIAFLTGLHLIAGNDYDRIIFFQTLILGMLPMFVYLCGRDLHSYETGIAASLLVILRETHSILAAPFGHNVSTTKYFFADQPAALVCAAFIWLLIRWQKSAADKKGPRWAFASGCALGAMVLIRTQSFCLLFLILFPLTAAFRQKTGQGIRQLILFAAALCFCVLPWLMRSYRITGQLVFDHPMTQTSEMARSYNFDGEDLSKLPEENDGDYTRR
ncbi:MAG: glycosyltransferase family 39 protein, partial [Anaerolineaceae bacterium]|nr:glycosyltransferase family 39 protein [Anaerolineaceae bacterium]